MKPLLFGLMAAALVTTACERNGYREDTGTVGTTGTAEYGVNQIDDDEAITSEVEANLLALPDIEQDIASGRLDVDTSGGVVTLDGSVGSEAEMENAVSMAWSVAGVTRVDNRLDVEHQ